MYKKPSHSESRHLRIPKRQQWSVFGNVQREYFDPLAFSKHVGDYPMGGTDKGGRWIRPDLQIPERGSGVDIEDLLPKSVATELEKDKGWYQ